MLWLIGVCGDKLSEMFSSYLSCVYENSLVMCMRLILEKTLNFLGADFLCPKAATHVENRLH